MKIYSNQPNHAILNEIGLRIKQRRISLSITQQDLSEKTGISLRSITNIENGSNFSLNHLISILKVLKLSEVINILIPESKMDPLVLLNSDQPRKRASKIKQATDWKWGDEK